MPETTGQTVARQFALDHEAREWAYRGGQGFVITRIPPKRRRLPWAIQNALERGESVGVLYDADLVRLVATGQLCGLPRPWTSHYRPPGRGESSFFLVGCGPILANLAAHVDADASGWSARDLLEREG